MNAGGVPPTLARVNDAGRDMDVYFRCRDIASIYTDRDGYVYFFKVSRSAPNEMLFSNVVRELDRDLR